MKVPPPPTPTTTTTSTNSNSNSFSVLTYNVLAKSLATNMIPWVMKITNEDIMDRFNKNQKLKIELGLEKEKDKDDNNNNNNNHNDYSNNNNQKEEEEEDVFHKFVNTKLKPHYLKHFHKNFDSGSNNYVLMRQLWSSPCLKNQDDIPIELSDNGVKFVDEDCISYVKKKKSSHNNNNNSDNNNDTTTAEEEEPSEEEKEEKVMRIAAKTLRGLSKQYLTSSSSDDDDGGSFEEEEEEDPTLFNDFFEDVLSREQTVFDWNICRGKRLLDTILDSKADIIALQEYDFHNNNNEPITINNCNDNTDTKTSQTTTLTFADAMISQNYDGVFLKDPLLSRNPPSGLGLFWNRNVFETTTSTNKSPFFMEILDCNTSSGSISNIDLKEVWHKRMKKKTTTTTTGGEESGESSSLSSSSLSSSSPELLSPSDRRNVGICTLRHKPTGKLVKIVVVHFMTTSRDSINTNWFPGEVRAGEIQHIKKLITTTMENNDSSADDDEKAPAVIVLGDMNTNALDPKEITKVFGGKVPKATATTSTTTTAEEEGKQQDGSSSQTELLLPEVLQFDTGFDMKTSTFHWGGGDNNNDCNIKLKDAFENQHRWGGLLLGDDDRDHQEDQGDDDDDIVNNNSNNNNNKCTSRNSNRMEWIDYVFYDTTKLSLKETSNCQIDQPIPNESHPSDHIPLYAKFEFN